ncbi:MAG: NADPH:quinone oxidoreductase family protein [Herpetosiphonaceae bacterium]|nr:NADPH:quinone oxidoreductase family protein [Herpetosiphonaceae bacterium]
MRAMLCREYGPPEGLVLEEVAPLAAGPGQVVVRVHACGVNFPDTLIIQGQYQFKPAFPFAPGAEIAGVVTAVGAGVERIQLGDRVIAFLGWGGFADEVVADAGRIIPLPAELDFTTAAAFVLTYATSYHALLDRARLQPGETLLVLGAAGGVGLAAVELGKLLGARVIAAASTSAKLEVCRQYGADELINYTDEHLKERLKQITGGKGVDVVYDPVGGPYSETALRATAWNGRLLVVGFASGEIPRIPLNLALLKGCALVGVFWGEFTVREPQRNQQELQQLLGWLQSGQLKPHISATYPLERAVEALNDLQQRRVIGKAVVTME